MKIDQLSETIIDAKQASELFGGCGCNSTIDVFTWNTKGYYESDGREDDPMEY